MNDDAFARLVAEEVKNRVSRNQREYLNLPENWTRWQRALIALDENLDGQLTRLDEDATADRQRYEALGEDGLKLLAEAMSDYEGRRSKVDRFRFHVGKRLDEVSRMIALGVEAAGDDITAYSFLRKAIERHRQMLEEYDLESTPIDHALWDSLDGKWTFDQVTQDDIFANDED
jgi:hypothetical protein